MTVECRKKIFLRVLSAFVVSFSTANAVRPIVDLNATSPTPYRNHAVQALHGGVTATNEVNDMLNAAFVDRAEYVGSNCVSTDGIASYITYGVLDVSAWTKMYLSGWFYLESGQTVGDRLFSLVHSSGDDIRLWLNGDSLVFSVDDGTAYDVTKNGIVDNTWHYIEASFSDGVSSLAVDGESSQTTPASFNFSTASGLTAIGAYGTGANFCSLKFNELYFTSDVGNYILSSAAEGGGNTIHNNISGKPDGTLINATLATAWTSTQNNVHDHLENGFSLYEHATLDPIYVSFLTTGIPNPSPTIPAGYTLTKHVEGCLTSGAIHNGAETQIRATDTNLYARAFWSDDDTTFTNRSYSYCTNYYANSNGTDGVYLRKTGDTISYITTYDTNWLDSVSAGVTNLLNASYGR